MKFFRDTEKLSQLIPGFKIKISDYFKAHSKENAVLNLFTKYENQSIILPDKFLFQKSF